MSQIHEYVYILSYINQRTYGTNYIMELFTFRKEIKYILPYVQALILKKQLDRLMTRDDHCIDTPYSVRSLYFDSVNGTDFSDKLSGLEVRKKIRLRVYDNDFSLCKLELKQKTGDWQQKHSLILPMEAAEKLAYGNYGSLKKYFQDNETSIKAYNIMSQGLYRPVVQIEYDRIAYHYPMYDTRITLDMNIRSSESNMDLFAKKINYTPVMPENVVLEIKYSGKLMGFISGIFSPYHLTQNSYSKYCSGRQIYYDFLY